MEVLHVREHDLVPSKAGMSPDLEGRDEAQAVVDSAVERLKAQGVSVTGRLLQAQTRDVPRVIIAAAETYGADLIIVGRRGLSSLAGMLVGSVSNKLIHVANVSILVAQGDGSSLADDRSDIARQEAKLENENARARILEQGGTFIR